MAIKSTRKRWWKEIKIIWVNVYAGYHTHHRREILLWMNTEIIIYYNIQSEFYYSLFYENREKKTIIFLYNIDDTTNVWSLNHHECPNFPWYPFKGIPDLFDLSRSVILIRCVMLLISTLVNLESFFFKLSKCIWNRIGLYHCMLLIELRVFNAIWIRF